MPKTARCQICGEMIRECMWDRCNGYVSFDDVAFTGWVHVTNGRHYCKDGRMAIPETADESTSTGS